MVSLFIFCWRSARVASIVPRRLSRSQAINDLVLESFDKNSDFGGEGFGVLHGVAGARMTASDLISDLESTGIWEGVFGATKLPPGGRNRTRDVSVPFPRFRGPFFLKDLVDNRGVEGIFVGRQLV